MRHPRHFHRPSFTKRVKLFSPIRQRYTPASTFAHSISGLRIPVPSPRQSIGKRIRVLHPPLAKTLSRLTFLHVSQLGFLAPVRADEDYIHAPLRKPFVGVHHLGQEASTVCFDVREGGCTRHARGGCRRGGNDPVSHAQAEFAYSPLCDEHLHHFLQAIRAKTLFALGQASRISSPPGISARPQLSSHGRRVLSAGTCDILDPTPSKWNSRG